MQDTREKLSRITVTLHWIAGLTFIGLLVMGTYMVSYEVWPLYSVHNSIGILFSLVVLIRVAWRIRNGWPIPVSQHKLYEHRLARLSLWCLIIATVLMPLSGYILVVANGNELSLFGIELLATNFDPNDAQKVLAPNKPLSNFAWKLHEILGIVMIAVVGLHIAAALKHHFINKDGTLRRMLGRNYSQ